MPQRGSLVYGFPTSLAPSSEVLSLVTLSLTSICTLHSMLTACPAIMLYFEVSITAPFSPCWQSIWQYNLPQTWLTSFNIHISFLRTLPFAAFAFSDLTSLVSFSLDITGVCWAIQVRWERPFVQLKGFGYHTLSGSLLWVKDFCQWVWQPCPWHHTLWKVSPQKPSQLYLVMGWDSILQVPKL